MSKAQDEAAGVYDWVDKTNQNIDDMMGGGALQERIDNFVQALGERENELANANEKLWAPLVDQISQAVAQVKQAEEDLDSEGYNSENLIADQIDQVLRSVEKKDGGAAEKYASTLEKQVNKYSEELYDRSKERLTEFAGASSDLEQRIPDLVATTEAKSKSLRSQMQGSVGSAV